MTAQDALNTAIMTAAFLLVTWAMLTGGTGEPEHGGRHRADRTGTGTVFYVITAQAADGAPLPCSWTPGPDGALPFAPTPDYRDEPDDWTADLPTDELPVITVRTWLPGDRVHTSPSQTARQRWSLETPIFAALAAEHGYDLTELIAA